MPRVSVIIPTYNPGPYLKFAIQSVLKQTFTDWEIIVIDDGSTEDILSSVPNHPSIKYVRQKNRGLAIARNVGIFHSVGELVTFLDADDLWRESKLAEQVSFMDMDREVALCHTKFIIINSVGEKIGDGFEGCNKDYMDLLKGCGICVSSCMIRRGELFAAGLFNPFLKACEDYDLWLRVAKSNRLFRIEKVLVEYRMHEANMSNMYYRNHVHQVSILKNQIAAAAGNKEIIKAARSGISRAAMLYGTQAFAASRACFKKRDWKNFMFHMLYALRFNPFCVVSGILRYKVLRNWRRPS